MGATLIVGFVFLMATVAAGVWLASPQRKRGTVLAVTLGCALVTAGQWGLIFEQQPFALTYGDLVNLVPWTLLTLWAILTLARRCLPAKTPK